MSDKVDMNALFKISYGLYVITTNDGVRDNACIVNTVAQVANDKVSVSVNKSNYTCETIIKNGIMNALCLSVEAPFKVFEAFGFKSGRDTDKFADCTPERSENGLAVLPRIINSLISLRVRESLDLGSHMLFICDITESRIISDAESMTYSYYHANVKPKPSKPKKKGYVCKICGYVYEGEELPADFICPLCKHGAEDFEPLE